MPDKPDIGVIYCYIATMWDPDYAFDDPALDDDPVDSAMPAVRCHEAG